MSNMGKIILAILFSNVFVVAYAQTTTDMHQFFYSEYPY